MSVSSRFRDITRDMSEFQSQVAKFGDVAAKGERDVRKARNALSEWVEQVGEIPRMSLEFKITPILLKAHNNLDRARLFFEEKDLDHFAATAWDLQQKIYRLLNDL